MIEDEPLLDEPSVPPAVLRVVCTDAGQHARWTFATVRGGRVMVDGVDTTGLRTQRFECGRCHAGRPVRTARLLSAELAATRPMTVDLSRIP